jgi:hypothetical protein
LIVVDKQISSWHDCLQLSAWLRDSPKPIHDG